MTDEMLNQLEETRVAERKATVADILADLADFLKDCPAGEREGLTAAIEIIQANY